MIAAVVLAAGASTRLGEPKQLVMLGSETLLERAVRIAREAGCTPVVVVLGADAARIRERCELGEALSVVNERWEEGMASSIRVGVGAVAAADGVVLMTCDQPAVNPGHLKLLMVGREVKASRYAGRNGVPVYFPRKCFSELMTLTGDAGARSLLAQAASQEMEHGELDVDTAKDMARARELFG